MPSQSLVQYLLVRCRPSTLAPQRLTLRLKLVLNLPDRNPHDIDGVADHIGRALRTCWSLGHVGYSRTTMSLNLRPLNSEEIAAREAGLDLASKLVDAPRPLTMDDVQALYDALLNVNQPPSEALTAMGLSFAEQIVAASGFEWVHVSDDEFGDEVCVAAPENEIYCSPISMIQKRLQQGERLSLAELRDDTVATIRRRIEEGWQGSARPPIFQTVIVPSAPDPVGRTH
jgi:hypothetical protein